MKKYLVLLAVGILALGVCGSALAICFPAGYKIVPDPAPAQTCHNEKDGPDCNLAFGDTDYELRIGDGTFCVGDTVTWGCTYYGDLDRCEVPEHRMETDCCDPVEDVYTKPSCTIEGLNGQVITETDESFGTNFYRHRFYVTFKTPGEYQVTVKLSDDNIGSPVNDDEGACPTTTVDHATIKVKPKAPGCFDSNQGSRLGCSADGGEGSGCGSCGSGGGGDLPWASITNPFVYEPMPYPSGAGGSSFDTGSGSCNTNRVQALDAYDGKVYLQSKSGCGTCDLFDLGPKPASGSNPISIALDNGGLLTGSLDSSGNTEFQFTYGDGTTVKYEAMPALAGGVYVASSGPTKITAPNGMETTFSYGSTVDQVTTPPGDVWEYTHAAGDTKITKIQQSGSSTYTEIAYEDDGSAAWGKLSSVAVKDSSGALSETNYSYYDDGKLKKVEKGESRTRFFEYSTDGKTITIKDTKRLAPEATPGPDDILAETIYDYHEPAVDPDNDPTTLTTTVIHRDPSTVNPKPDQVTYYCFYKDSNGNKTYLRRVIDPYGKTTEYNNVDPDDVTQVVTSRVYYHADPSGIVTEFEYNTIGAVTKITQTNSDHQQTIETNTYYSDPNDATKPTVWRKTHRDIRGSWTYYERNASTLWQVDAIKIAPPGAEPNWNSVNPIKRYEYYTANCDDGMVGMLKKEIIPDVDVDTDTDQITEYKYGYGPSGPPYEWRNSPTKTSYQYWNGAAYVDNYNTTSYDDQGHVISTSDDNGNGMWYAYDDLGRQILSISKWTDGNDDNKPDYIIDPITGDLSGSEVQIYSQSFYSCCTLKWSRDENGNKTHYAYDDLNRIKKTWTGISGQNEDYPLVEYVYDSFGNKEQVKTRSDAGTVRTTSYTYDKLNRVTKIDYPDGIIHSDEFGYDEITRSLLWKKAGTGSDNSTSDNVTLYKYDTWNRLTNVYYADSLPQPFSYPANADVSYGYEGNTSIRTSMVNITPTNGYLTSGYTYDWQGRLDHYTPPMGLDSGYYVDYGYNDAGMKSSVSITNGSSTPYDVSYEYYANGWLKNVKRKDGANFVLVAEYTYDTVGNRTQQNNGNNTYTVFDYDENDSRYSLESITHKLGQTTLAEISYPSRDDAGNPESMITIWGGNTLNWTYGYDANNRLTSAIAPNPVPDQPAGGNYGYDWVGNRLSPSSDPNSMVYNAANQLTSWLGMHSYTYWPDGSLKEVKTGQNTVASYSYSDNGLLVTASYAGRSSTFTWDADSNRVGMSMNGGDYSFAYDIMARIPAVIQENVDGTPVYYYRAPSGYLIARYSQTDGMRYYHFDELGSTRLLTNSSGSITNRYNYDNWGSIISQDRYPGSIDQSYQYVGESGYYTHYQDSEFGLLQLGVRSYNPQICRFIQSDSENDEVKDYLYVNNEPTTSIDPDGHVSGKPGGKRSKGGSTSCDPNTGQMVIGPTNPNLKLKCQKDYVMAHEKVHQRDITPCCQLYAKCYKKYDKATCDSSWSKYFTASLAWTEWNAYHVSLRFINSYFGSCECRNWLQSQLELVIGMINRYSAGDGAKDPCSKFFAPDGKPK